MSDIVAAARLALRLLESGFSEANVADVRYTNFQNDIFNLHHLLEQLNEALQSAQRRYSGCPQPIGIQAYEPLSSEVEQERRTLTGDFVATLSASDALLTENRRVRQRYGQDPKTLRWHLSEQESRIDNLRLQLRLHVRKICFVLECLSSELLTKSVTKIDSPNFTANAHVRGTNAKFYGMSSYFPGHRNYGNHVVSDRIASRFHAALAIDASVTDLSVPIDRGFDALLTSLEQSTSGVDQTPEKHLALLKTRWLLHRIKTSPEYLNAYPGVYFQHTAEQITQALDMQRSQPGRMIAYSDDVLMGLPESSFQIWQPSTLPARPIADTPNESNPLTARATEEKIICIPLASGPFDEPDSLTVFKSSDDRFRLVFQSSQSSRLGNRMIIPQSIYTCEDKLIPRYALPNLATPGMEMAIFSRNEETLYTFNSMRDVHDFQTALTGYDVSHDQQDIRCQFSDEAASLDCRGRIQLWQEPIAIKSGSEGSHSSESSTIGARTRLSDRAQSVRGSIASSIATTQTVHRADGGWEADSVKLATLTIFTELPDRKKKKRFAIVSVELGLGVGVDPNECKCCRDYNTCSKLVLTKGKKTKLMVRALYTDLDSLGQPNTNTFDLLPFRTPQQPTPNTVVSKQTEYLVLKFPSLPEKRRFDEELQLRFRVRDAQVKNQLDFAKSIRQREGQRPGRLEPPSLFDRKLSLTPSIVSLPPKLDVPDNGPTLTDAMKNMQLAELIGSAKPSPLPHDIVEVSGDKPLVELATEPKMRSMSMTKDVKSFDTYFELPGGIPWFPT